MESTKYVEGLIAKEEAAGIPASRIVLGGFSQGGVVALKTATSRPTPLGGVVGLSTFFDALPGETVPDNVKKVPILIGHGSADPLVPVESSSVIEAALARLGFTDVTKRIYPGMQHSSCPEELGDFRTFLLKTVPETPPTA